MILSVQPTFIYLIYLIFVNLYNPLHLPPSVSYQKERDNLISAYKSKSDTYGAGHGPAFSLTKDGLVKQHDIR